MKMKHVLPVAVMVAGGALAITGCSSSAAQPSETLSIACSQTKDFCDGMVAAFSKQTGVAANYLALGSGEVIARLQATGGSGSEFDVWAGGQNEKHLVADQLGFVEPYVSPNAKGLDAEFADPKGVWAGFYTDSLAFCVNTQSLEKAGLPTPTNWADLIDPKYKGALILPNPASVGTGYMAIWTQMVLNHGDEDATFTYLGALNKNILQYSENAANATLSAGRGEASVAIALDSDCATAKAGGMKDLKIVYPEEGTGYEVGAVSILKGTKHAGLAKKFYDWLLTTDAQDLYPSVNSNAAPVNPDAKLGKGVPDQSAVKHVEWDPAAASAAQKSLLERFKNDVQS